MKLNTLSQLALMASSAIVGTSALSSRQAGPPDNSIFLSIQNGGADVNFIEVFLDQVADLSGQGIVGDGATITSMGSSVPAGVNCQVLLDDVGELIPIGHLITPGNPVRFSFGASITFGQVHCSSTLLPEPPFADVVFILKDGTALPPQEFQVSQTPDVPIQFLQSSAIQNAIQWSIVTETGPLDSTEIVCAAYSDFSCSLQVGAIANGRGAAILNTDGNPVPIQCVSCVEV